MLHFYTPWKYKKISGFLFSGVIEVEHWLKTGLKNWVRTAYFSEQNLIPTK